MTRNPKGSGRGSRKRPSSREDPAFYESLGNAIKVIRTQQRLERKQLAEAAGVSYAYLSDIETGRGRPSSGALLAIAEALGMAPHELMFAAEGNQVSSDKVEFRLAGPATMAAPSLRKASRESWFSGAEPPASAMMDALPAGSDARAELAAAIDELDPEDLEMVLDLVHRIQGKRRSRPQ